MKKIAIFASGTGSNTDSIIRRFKSHHRIRVALIVTNNKEAGVAGIANFHSVPLLILDKEKFFRGDDIINYLQSGSIEFIVLAGFLWKIPPYLINAYQGKIINIHPALLPKYGGNGMYGMHVHRAVLANQEKESGLTVHYVDELYDHGQIILQVKCPVTDNDTAGALAERIQQLEHQHYPAVIELLLKD